MTFTAVVQAVANPGSPNIAICDLAVRATLMGSDRTYFLTLPLDAVTWDKEQRDAGTERFAWPPKVGDQIPLSLDLSKPVRAG